MTIWQRHSFLEDELKKVDERLAKMRDSIEPQFDRAVILRELGHTDEAKNAYLELLARAPTHFGALTNLGTLAAETGFHTAARTAYCEAVKHHPDNPTAQINLANALARNGEAGAAIRHYEIALRLDPENPDAHQGLSRLLTEIGDEEHARIHRIKGFQNRPIKILPYRGKSRPIELLVLASAAGGAVPIWHHLDDQIFLTCVLFMDFYNPALPIPTHQIVFNAIGDADLEKQSLDAAAKLLQRTNAPVINHPETVMATGRAANSTRLSNIPGIVVPRIEWMRRELLDSAQAVSLLRDHGFSFPLLLRSPGYHNGQFFTRIENEQALGTVLPNMPGQELMVIQYLDARSADGKIRKYRVMIIDGTIYPLHVAISNQWKIHFATAEMADNSDHRAEDAAFLNDMCAVLGPKAIAGLEKIRSTIGLDYAGVDFSLNSDGEVLFFEANATMVVNPPDADKKWDYRRSAVQRILDAIRDLLTKNR